MGVSLRGVSRLWSVGRLRSVSRLWSVSWRRRLLVGALWRRICRNKIICLKIQRPRFRFRGFYTHEPAVGGALAAGSMGARSGEYAAGSLITVVEEEEHR